MCEEAQSWNMTNTAQPRPFDLALRERVLMQMEKRYAGDIHGGGMDLHAFISACPWVEGVKGF